MDHKIVKHTPEGPIIYCPVVKDTAIGGYTSIGHTCALCGKHVVDSPRMTR